MDALSLLQLRFCEEGGRGLGMAAGWANLWYLSHFLLWYLRKRTFVLHQLLTCPPPSRCSSRKHPSLPFALLLSHQWDSSAPVPLKQYCFLHTQLHVAFQSRQTWFQIPSQMYCSLALWSGANYLISTLGKNTQKNLFLIALLWGLNNECKVPCTINGSFLFLHIWNVILADVCWVLPVCLARL